MGSIETYQLLSGYIGTNLVELTRYNKDMTELQADYTILNNKQWPKTPPSYYFSKTIHKLYNKYISTPNLIRTSGFQEQLILEFFIQFKNITFIEWLALQVNSPLFSSLHESFLRDTLKYILEGSRSVNIISWVRMINGYEEYNLHKERDLDLGNYPKIIKDFTSEELVQLWVSRDNGFEDLIITLNLFFGNKYE